jgi:poly(3-hydroxyalkanoate) synthetase
MFRLLPFDEILKTLGYVPKIYLQMLFFLSNPEQFREKTYRYFAIDSSEKKALFLRVERWLNSGYDLPLATYLQIVGELIRNNALSNNTWHVKEVKIDPALIQVPFFITIAQQDLLVPYTSSAALIKRISSYGKAQITLTETKGGHIAYLIGEELDSWATEINSWMRGKI